VRSESRGSETRVCSRRSRQEESNVTDMHAMELVVHHAVGQQNASHDNRGER
jgi:hypothetical protein